MAVLSLALALRRLGYGANISWRVDEGSLASPYPGRMRKHSTPKPRTAPPVAVVYEARRRAAVLDAGYDLTRQPDNRYDPHAFEAGDIVMFRCDRELDPYGDRRVV